AAPLRRRDRGGDLAQALLLLGPAAELRPGAVELGDQAGVLDRDRGLVGERLEELGARLVVDAVAVAADRDRPRRAVLATHRRGEDRDVARGLDELVGLLDVGEPVVGEIVVREERLDTRDPWALLSLTHPTPHTL